MLDLPALHEGEELPFVGGPVALTFLVGVEELLRRGQDRRMLVLSADELPQEIRKVLRLGEAGELR